MKLYEAACVCSSGTSGKHSQRKGVCFYENDQYWRCNSSNCRNGLWYLGEGNAEQSARETQALKYGLDHGLRVIDTAEMYGNGAAETLIGSF